MCKQAELYFSLSGDVKNNFGVKIVRSQLQMVYPAPVHDDFHNMRILIAEDDEVLADGLTRAMQQAMPWIGWGMVRKRMQF